MRLLIFIIISVFSACLYQSCGGAEEQSASHVNTTSKDSMDRRLTGKWRGSMTFFTGSISTHKEDVEAEFSEDGRFLRTYFNPDGTKSSSGVCGYKIKNGNLLVKNEENTDEYEIEFITNTTLLFSIKPDSTNWNRKVEYSLQKLSTKP